MAVSIPQHSGYTVKYGTGTGLNGERILVWVEYKVVSKNIVNNSSLIDAYFYSALNPNYTSNTYGSSGLYSSFAVGGVGGNVVSNGAYDYRNANNLVYLGSFNGSVPHNDDGKKSLTIEGSFSTKSSYITGGKISFTTELPLIERASIPILSESSAQMGKDLTITTNRLSSSFTHTVYYTFGGEKVTMATGVGDSYIWTVPDLAAKCNNATSGLCTITCDTYNGSTKVGSKAVDVVLNVPDATVPDVGISSASMGGLLTIKTPRKSANFTHKISYAFGTKSGTIAEGVAASTSWAIPYSLATEIPDATSGMVAITCETYNGSALVGSEETSIYILVPNNATTKPTISATFVPSHSLGSAFDGMYIQGKSSVKAVVTAESKYSDIATYKLTVNGETKSSSSGEITSAILGVSGSITVKVEVVDARGYSNSVEETIPVVAYGRPAMIPYDGENKVVCERCTTDGIPDNAGTHLLIKVVRRYSAVIVNGVQKNFCELRYRYKSALSETYSDWKTLIDSSSLGTDVYNGVVNGIEFDTKFSFNIEVGVVDSIGGETDATAILFDIPTDAVAFHLGKDGNKASFGKYAERDNALEIDDSWELYLHNMTMKEYIQAVINGTV